MALQQPVVNFFSGNIQARNGVTVSARNLDDDAFSEVVVGGNSVASAYRGRELGHGSTHLLYSILEETGPTGGVFVG